MDNDKFLDFPTFFNVIKDSSTSLKNEDLFDELTKFLYLAAEKTYKSPKDAVSDILRKKTAFPRAVREVATEVMIPKICEGFEAQLWGSIYKPDILVSKLLYLVSEDTLFFEQSDLDILLSNKDNPRFVIAYILIKTVVTSDRSKDLKHSDDYNPFKNYHEQIPEKKQNPSKVEEDLRATGRYLFGRYGNYSITEKLLSNGKTMGFRMEDDLFNESFSIVSDSDGNSRPLQDYMSSNEDLLVIGEGGIGKTTALLTYMKSLGDGGDTIPLYVRLSDCSTYTDHEHMILNSLMNSMGYAVNGKITESFKDLLDEFSKDPAGRNPRYTLLLDGFNEITSMDMGEIRSSIAGEINSLLELGNVRIVLTTRESDLYGIRVTDFTTVRATGIKRSDVEEFLRKSITGEELDKILADNELMQYLQIPLFLKMFTYSEDKFGFLPKTKGEILFRYYNGLSSLYTEKQNRNDKSDRKESLIACLLLDFILPQLGYHMVAHESFQVDMDFIEALVNDSNEYISRNISNNPVLKAQYNDHILSTKKVISVFKELDPDDLILFLTDGLGALYKDAEGHIYFCHQYVRDYFSALYCVNGITDMALSQDKVDLHGTNMVFWGFSRWDDEHIKLISEILRIYPKEDSFDLIYKAICRMRGMLFGGSVYACTLSNLINTLSFIEDSDLSRYDFSDLDLRECRLNDINFSNPYTGNKSSFSGAFISEATFASDSHKDYVKKWTISDEDHYIVSLSVDMEVKIWNIANQKCIYTSRISDIRYEREIIQFKYIESQNTLLVMDYDFDEKDFPRAWTFDTKTFEYREYHPQNPRAERILHFGYDYINKQFVLISDDSVMYTYYSKLTEIQDVYPLDPEFTEVLFWRRNVFESKEVILNFDYLWDIYLLDDNKLLLITWIFNSTDSSANLTPWRYNWEMHSELICDIEVDLCVYDRRTKDLIHLFIDGADEDLSTFSVYSGLHEDIVNKYITISNDKRKIAIHNEEYFYVYDIEKKDNKFREIDEIPVTGDCTIKYCNCSDVLTFCDEKQVVQYDVENHRILYEMTSEEIWDFNKELCTANYKLHTSKYATNEVTVTNLYTKKSGFICLEDDSKIILSFEWNDQLEILYTNGTLISLDKNNLAYNSIYNISHKRRILDCAYSEKRNSLCIVTKLSQSQLFPDDLAVIFYDLNTGKKEIFPELFSIVHRIEYIFNDQYILLISYFEYVIISQDDHVIVDRLRYVHEKYSFVDVLCNDDLLRMVFSYTGFDRSIMYEGFEQEVRLIDEKIKVGPRKNIPSIRVEDIPTNFLIRDIPRCWDRFAWIRSVDGNDHEINVLGHNYMISSKEWQIVYLESDMDENGLHFDDNNTPIIHYTVRNSKDNSCLASYEYDNYLFDFQEGSMHYVNLEWDTPLYYDDDYQVVYVMEGDSDKLCIRNIKGNNPFSEQILYPHQLIYGCDFSELNGCIDAIPKYIQEVRK